jgi:hypothetical protein
MDATYDRIVPDYAEYRSRPIPGEAPVLAQARK